MAVHARALVGVSVCCVLRAACCVLRAACCMLGAPPLLWACACTRPAATLAGAAVLPWPRVTTPRAGRPNPFPPVERHVRIRSDVHALGNSRRRRARPRSRGGTRLCPCHGPDSLVCASWVRASQCRRCARACGGRVCAGGRRGGYAPPFYSCVGVARASLQVKGLCSLILLWPSLLPARCTPLMRMGPPPSRGPCCQRLCLCSRTWLSPSRYCHSVRLVGVGEGSRPSSTPPCG